MGELKMKYECQKCENRAGWAGVLVNLYLAIIKFVVGFLGGSTACIADGLLSSANIATAFTIFISRRLTGKPCDEDHPYGHGKAEFVVAGVVSVIIMILTIIFVVREIEHVFYKPQPTPHIITILAAIISVISNELLFRYLRCVGTELHSQTIIANAWSNRAEAFGSATVIVGVIGAQLGFHHLDPIAAMIVGVLIMKVSISVLWESITGLMDRSVPSNTLGELRQLINQVEEVQGIHHLRARQMGDKIWVDVSIRVPSNLTIKNCESIRSKVRQRLIGAIREIGEVLVDFDAVHVQEKST